jgi:NADPH2:quinone reductase
MKAWQVHESGEPAKVMQLREIKPPVAPAGQVLIKVLACSVGFPDVLMCRGEYQERPDLPYTPGAEVCGEVVSSPAGSGLATGGRVLGLASAFIGGLAEQVSMNLGQCMPAPADLSNAQAATLFSAYQTGWFGLHRRAALQPGEVLLVQAAAGGVGLAAIQLGLAAGATVIGVARGERKAAIVREQGAHLVIDKTRESVIDRVKTFTDGHGADVVYDPVGGESYVEATRCVAFEGRIVLVGFAGGQIQTQRLNHPLLKNYSIVGLHFSLYARNQPDAVRDAHEQLSALVRTGAVRPVVGERYAFENASEAMQKLADGQSVGRGVVLGA